MRSTEENSTLLHYKMCAFPIVHCVKESRTNKFVRESIFISTTSSSIHWKRLMQKYSPFLANFSSTQLKTHWFIFFIIFLDLFPLGSKLVATYFMITLHLFEMSYCKNHKLQRKQTVNALYSVRHEKCYFAREIFSFQKKKTTECLPFICSPSWYRMPWNHSLVDDIIKFLIYLAFSSFDRRLLIIIEWSRERLMKSAHTRIHTENTEQKKRLTKVRVCASFICVRRCSKSNVDVTRC